MPATTPFRGYPYPVPGDPVNVPGDLQALAEAIDDDLEAVSAMIAARPSAQMRSSQAQSVAPLTLSGGTLQLAALRFDSVDFDTGGFTSITTQPTLLTLTVGRVYWVWATVQFPAFDNTTEDESVLFRITSTDLTQAFVDLEAFQSDTPMLSRVHTIGGMYIPTAGDEQLQVNVAHNSDTGAKSFTNASFGVMEIRATP